MKKFTLFIIVVVSLISCQYNNKVKKGDNPDTPILTGTTFKPLDIPTAYAFMNEFILPSLDKTSNGRQLYIHPMLLSQQTTSKKTVKNRINLTSAPIQIDTMHSWDIKRLDKVRIIRDADLKEFDKSKWSETGYSIRWQKKFGFGYVCVSYPVYNSSINRLIVRMYSEDDTGCGTGRDRYIYYSKTIKGWHFENGKYN